jgi:hypothetical protein
LQHLLKFIWKSKDITNFYFNMSCAKAAYKLTLRTAPGGALHRGYEAQIGSHDVLSPRQCVNGVWSREMERTWFCLLHYGSGITAALGIVQKDEVSAPVDLKGQHSTDRNEQRPSNSSQEQTTRAQQARKVGNKTQS